MKYFDMIASLIVRHLQGRDAMTRRSLRFDVRFEIQILTLWRTLRVWFVIGLVWLVLTFL